MSVMDSKATLSRAVKDLFARWNEVKTFWSDTQSEEFEKTFLDPIEQDVRSAMSALDAMNMTLMTIEHDCE